MNEIQAIASQVARRMPGAAAFTWREIVMGVLHAARTGELSIVQIYEALQHHPKTSSNRCWRAAVRRVLLSDPQVEKAGRGRWRIKVLRA